jgi:hypothetical protein
MSAARNVVGPNLAQLLFIGAAMGFQVIVILYMQRALGFGPAAAGLGLVPTAVRATTSAEDTALSSGSSGAHRS